jgi:hypothetical protein
MKGSDNYPPLIDAREFEIVEEVVALEDDLKEYVKAEKSRFNQVLEDEYNSIRGELPADLVEKTAQDLYFWLGREAE